jgi:hypothetical protein
MKNTPEESAQIGFAAEISDPDYSPPVANLRDMVTFKLGKTLVRGTLNHSVAQLISETGEVQPVTVRATGRMRGDALIAVDGITLEQAQSMRKIIQYIVPQGTPFIGDVIDVVPSPDQEGMIDIRVRPQPYRGIYREAAQIIDAEGQSIPIVIHRIMHAPPSLELGRYGDVIIRVEGITLDQARMAQRLTQEVRKE